MSWCIPEFISIYFVGRVALAPPMLITVCPGDQLVLTCNTSSGAHQWMIEDPNIGSMYTRTIVVSSSIAEVTPLKILSFIFNFAVISPPSELPLISTLSVDNISVSLNATRVRCLEIDSGDRQQVTVYIFRPNSLESMLQ